VAAGRFRDPPLRLRLRLFGIARKTDLAMPNPWDPFPFPLVGDENSHDTYAGMGRVASEWENIEIFARAPLQSFCRQTRQLGGCAVLWERQDLP